MPRARRSQCLTCRLPGTQGNPLYDQLLKNRISGQVQAVNVHAGGCTLALANLYEPITSVEESMTPKATATDTAAETDTSPAAEATQHLADAAPGPLPAVVADRPQAAPEAAAAEVVEHSPLPTTPGITTQQVVRWIAYNEPLPQPDPADIARAIALEIINAPSLDAALRENTITHAKDLLYRPLRIEGVKWQPSDMGTEGSPVYAVMDVVITDVNERAMVTCGGMNIVAALVKADLENAWPITVRINEASETTRSGFKVYRMTKVEEAEQQTLDGDGQGF